MSQRKVTKEQIDAIMDDVAYHVYRVPDTTTTIAVAFDKDGFSLGVGMSACVDPANFNEELGNQYACEGRAPPGARGLKPLASDPEFAEILSRSARGAWIETSCAGIAPAIKPVALRPGRVD